MSLRLDNTERQTVELADIILSSTRYMASWLRQRSWVLPQNRQVQLYYTACAWATENSCVQFCWTHEWHCVLCCL